MINRVLIRIKVIQILYSYLLVENKFTLEEAPAMPTKERRYAYGLYMNLLVLLILLSDRIERRRGEKPLNSTRFIERLRNDDRIRAELLKNNTESDEWKSLAARLVETVKNSGVYKIFLKEKDAGSLNAEEKFWPELVKLVLIPSIQLKNYAESLEGYSLKGYERMEEMVENTLTNFMGALDSLSEVLGTLEKSLELSRELYMRLLALAVDLTDLQERTLDSNRYKHLTTSEDLNPNMKFVENKAIKVLREDSEFKQYIEKNHISWLIEEPLMLRNLMKSISESEVYTRYMSNTEHSLKEDSDLWRELFRKVILENTDFLETLEEKSIFWNDDLSIIGDFVGKTFRRIEDGEYMPLLDKYKDEVDAGFGSALMRYVYKGRDEYRDWIVRAVADSQWDADRLAFMDVVILITALAEIMNFPEIPLRVSINEYIEIAKSYSSAKSGTFVHGLLAGILKDLREKGKLYKKD